MLVLSRYRGQEIIIPLGGGEKIVIAILGTEGSGKVRVGIDAPKHVPVHRREIYEQIEREERR